MMKKPLALCLALLMLVLPSFGCTAPAHNKPQPPAKPDANIVTDAFGRQIDVPENPQRIACLYAFTGHVATLLDMGPNIVACVEGLKRDKLLTQMVPSLLDAATPLRTDRINIEELIKSAPDLAFIREETAKDPRETEQLDKSGIPYLVITDTTIQKQREAIFIIGKALGKQTKAKAYLDYYQASVDRVKKVVDTIPQNERIRVFHSVNEATRTDVKGTLAAEWTAAAGAVNVSVDGDLRFADNKYFASLEQIYLWAPDVILAHEDNAINYIKTNEQWAALEAVKSGRVIKMPNGISRWGHPGSIETPLAVLWTAKTLYPQHFEDLNMEEETRSFYKVFFEIELSNEAVSNILSGAGMRLPKQTN